MYIYMYIYSYINTETQVLYMGSSRVNTHTHTHLAHDTARRAPPLTAAQALSLLALLVQKHKY